MESLDDANLARCQSCDKFDECYVRIAIDPAMSLRERAAAAAAVLTLAAEDALKVIHKSKDGELADDLAASLGEVADGVQALWIGEQFAELVQAELAFHRIVGMFKSIYDEGYSISWTEEMVENMVAAARRAERMAPRPSLADIIEDMLAELRMRFQPDEDVGAALN